MNKIQEIFNFDNIGGKIKNFAKWSCWITILLLWIATPILIIAAIAEGGGLIAVIVFPIATVIASLSVWVGSWALYGFGELIDKVCDNESHTKEILSIMKNKEQEKEEKQKTQITKSVTATVFAKPAEQLTNKNEGNADESPVSAIIRDGEKVCPKCGTAQRADRKVCWSCGQHFDN